MNLFQEFLSRLASGTWPLITERTAPVAWVVVAGVVVGLYLAKAWVLYAVVRPHHAALLFACVLGFCILLVWAMSPNWNNRYVSRAPIYVGGPVMTLTVPTLSFALDWIRRTNGAPQAWAWRVPFEIALGIPVWAVTWFLIESIVLGWF